MTAPASRVIALPTTFVDDDGSAALRGEAERGERVGCLPRLADADDERSVVDRQGAVAHLRPTCIVAGSPTQSWMRYAATCAA